MDKYEREAAPPYLTILVLPADTIDALAALAVAIGAAGVAILVLFAKRKI